MVSPHGTHVPSPVPPPHATPGHSVPHATRGHGVSPCHPWPRCPPLAPMSPPHATPGHGVLHGTHVPSLCHPWPWCPLRPLPMSPLATHAPSPPYPCLATVSPMPPMSPPRGTRAPSPWCPPMAPVSPTPWQPCACSPWPPRAPIRQPHVRAMGARVCQRPVRAHDCAAGCAHVTGTCLCATRMSTPVQRVCTGCVGCAPGTRIPVQRAHACAKCVCIHVQGTPGCHRVQGERVQGEHPRVPRMVPTQQDPAITPLRCFSTFKRSTLLITATQTRIIMVYFYFPNADFTSGT